MSSKPSDPDYINTKALERFMRSFDYVLRAKYNHDHSLGSIAPDNVGSKGTGKMLMKARAIVERHDPRLSFWYTFPPTNAILRFRDDIRLRKYNREWIKNNIH